MGTRTHARTHPPPPPHTHTCIPALMGAYMYLCAFVVCFVNASEAHAIIMSIPRGTKESENTSLHKVILFLFLSEV